MNIRQSQKETNEISSKPMKTKLFVLFGATLLLLAPGGAFAASNDLSTALQQGLFEEEANHNPGEAIQAYQSALREFEQARKLAATAVFRLGEVYRKQGKTNEANVQYERVLREFADQTSLATLSRSYLTAAGQSKPAEIPGLKPATADE